MPSAKLELVLSARDLASQALTGLQRSVLGLKTTTLGAFAAMGGAAVLFGRAVSTSIGSLDKLAQIGNLGFAADTEAIRIQIQKMAIETGNSTAAIRESFISVGRSVKDTSTALAITAEANRLATATFTENERAAAALVQVLQAYGSKAGTASQAAAVLNDLSQDTAFTFDETAAALEKIGPTLARAGVGFDETAAILETLSEGGLRGGRALGTLQTVTESLLAPTDAAAKELKKLGIDLDSGSASGADLVAALGKIDTAAAKDAGVLRRLGLSGNALSAAMVLAKNNGVEFQRNLDELGTSAKRFQDNFQNADQTLGGTLGQLKELAGAVLENTLLPILREINVALGEFFGGQEKLAAFFNDVGFKLAEVFIVAQREIAHFVLGAGLVLKDLLNVFLTELPSAALKGVRAALEAMANALGIDSSIAQALRLSINALGFVIEDLDFQRAMHVKEVTSEIEALDALIDGRFGPRLEKLAKDYAKTVEALGQPIPLPGDKEDPAKSLTNETKKLIPIVDSLASSFATGVVGAIERAVAGTQALGASLLDVLASLGRIVANEVLLQTVRGALSSFSFFNAGVAATAKGGIYGGHFEPIQEFGAGGIMHRSTLGRIAEVGRPEAVVPLPDGRSIPVALAGGGGVTNIYISAIDGPSISRFFSQPEAQRGVRGVSRSDRLTRGDMMPRRSR